MTINILESSQRHIDMSPSVKKPPKRQATSAKIATIRKHFMFTLNFCYSVYNALECHLLLTRVTAGSFCKGTYSLAMLEPTYQRVDYCKGLKC